MLESVQTKLKQASGTACRRCQCAYAAKQSKFSFEGNGSVPCLRLAASHTGQSWSTAGGGHSLGPNDWPGGCLGYAFNLVRPTRPGHRGSLLYSLLGTVLVFETLQDASAYRELVTQVGPLLLHDNLHNE